MHVAFNDHAVDGYTAECAKGPSYGQFMRKGELGRGPPLLHVLEKGDPTDGIQKERSCEEHHREYVGEVIGAD